MIKKQTILSIHDIRHFIGKIILRLTRYETLPVNNKQRIQIQHKALQLRKSLLFIRVNSKFLFVNTMICTLICITIQASLGLTLFVVFYLLAVRFSMKESDFLYLDSKSFIKATPMLNRWYDGSAYTK